MSKIVYTTPCGRGRFIEGPYTVDEEIEFYARQTPKRMHRNLQQTPQESPQKSEPQEPEDDGQGRGED
jgi:hypothetical protein